MQQNECNYRIIKKIHSHYTQPGPKRKMNPGNSFCGILKTSEPGLFILSDDHNNIVANTGYSNLQKPEVLTTLEQSLYNQHKNIAAGT